MSALVYQFAKVLYSQQASSELRMSSLVGTTAQVSVAIAAGRRRSDRGQCGRRELRAHRALGADGQAIARGTVVVVIAVRGEA